MTEEKLRRMMKYAELIRFASYREGKGVLEFQIGRYEIQAINDVAKYGRICDYLIHRMEREMKR